MHTGVPKTSSVFSFFLSITEQVVRDKLVVAVTKPAMSSSEVEMKAGHAPAGCCFAVVFSVFLRTVYQQLRHVQCLRNVSACPYVVDIFSAFLYCCNR